MNFKRLLVEDKKELKRFFNKKNNELCVYSPQTLIVWSADSYYPVYAVKKDSLFTGAVFPENKFKNHLILPVTDDKEILSPENMFSFLKNTDFSFFKYIPESYIQNFGKDHISRFFKIEEKKGDSDYIFKREDLAELKGRKYSKKRNLINQFLKSYGSRYTFESISKANTDEVLIFLEEWCLQRDCGKNPNSDIACEKQAAINAILNHDKLNYKSIALRIDTEIQAFAFASKLTEETYSLNFQKASSHIKGLYQFFDQLCAKELFTDEVLYINKESDMDDDGLRQAKNSYYPERMITSYNLYPVS